jgi:squalene-hopene/tetraprenyl-beta-curcumene cyclase
LAVEALYSCLAAGGRALARGEAYQAAALRGVSWLVDAVEANRHGETSPIGFYFAKLWYYEALYPLIMTVAALGTAARRLQPRASAVAAVAASTIAESPVGKR